MASILEINYNTMRDGTRVKVLKSMQKEMEELIQRNEKQLKKRIIEDIVYSGKIGFSQFVDYPRFLQFYEPYKDISTEREFARVVEYDIDSTRYNGTSVKILKSYINKRVQDSDETKEKMKPIQNNMMNQRNIEQTSEEEYIY